MTHKATQAILLQDVEKLGRKGDVINVAPGYLRNYLGPRRLAMVATADSVDGADSARVQVPGDGAEEADARRAPGGGGGCFRRTSRVGWPSCRACAAGRRRRRWR